ncbi:sensor histidine kinase [Alcanivorax jadensis]|uniref:sensor histidine kinase n=1 Tax=Alcanivorax jadensis TaxID=64988 RepID=UPI0026EE24AC|nr:sensor histidine kinase [Alcanivorax jadensis]
MLGRHSLLWRLALLLMVTAVCTVTLSDWLNRTLSGRALLLSDEAKTVMLGYAADAEQAWQQNGEAGVADWIAAMGDREPGDIMVVSRDDQSLSGTPLTQSERAGLRFQRGLEWRMSFRYRSMPYLGVPFPERPQQGSLVMQLPPRYMPGQDWPIWKSLLMVGLPALVALALGLLLFWRVRVPLRELQHQVQQFKDDPDVRVQPSLSNRGDEFGDVARSFNHMAEQVSAMLATQRQLLNDMSHELRTPLSRLAVALESDLDEPGLRQRVARELVQMRTLVNDALTLGWQDTESGEGAQESISLLALWDVVSDNAVFESGWERSRFPCDLPADAQVHGNLNVLAQVLENLVRNAVRYSPPKGRISLSGVREGGWWHLWITDQGPGVPADRLEDIFAPFVRLDSARAADSGFGLGLSIARRSVQRLGGELWAENVCPGLRVHLRLQAAV